MAVCIYNKVYHLGLFPLQLLQFCFAQFGSPENLQVLLENTDI